MTDAHKHAFLSKLPTRGNPWPNASAHVTRGVGAVLRIERVRAAGPIRCDALPSIDPDLLGEFLDAASAADAAFVSLAELRTRLLAKDAGRAACLTFDGADRSLVTQLAPALVARGLPLTVFVSPEAMDADAPHWRYCLEALAEKADRIGVAVRGQTYAGPCRTAEEASNTLEAVVPPLWSHPEALVRRAVFALCEADGVDMAALAQHTLGWDDLRALAKTPLISLGLLAPNCHAAGAASYDAVRDGFAAALARFEEQLGAKPAHLAFGAAWHGFVEPRDLEIAEKLGFKAACLPAGGPIFNEDATDFTVLPRMMLSDAPDAVLDAQAACGAGLARSAFARAVNAR
ncbi:MAG: hypothetical protein NW215_12065 [Hyphomicrobiales bacterium]|nr:hypothetical protein [Hyphomicrobiales bacterium]